MRVLLIFEDLAQREEIQVFFTHRGHQISAYRDPGEACADVRESPPDLVLLELSEPNEPAMELCRQLRQRTDESCYVLLVTPRESAPWLRDLLAAGADNYLRSPIDAQALELHLLIAERRLAERTENRKVEAALKRERAFFQQLFDNSPDGIAILDNDERIVDINRAFAGLFNYRLEEIRGKRLSDFIVPQHLRQEALQLTRAVLDRRSVHHETVRLRRDGTEVDVAILGYPIELADRKIGAYGIYTDITQRKQAERKLFHEAFHDSLTGLPNRSLLLESLQRALRRSRRRPDYQFAVLFLDLDRFKVINDSLGHPAGDQLLIEAARRLDSCLRPGDITARHGGDEFTILLDDLQRAADATRIAERILEALARPFRIGHQDVSTSGSIGIAFSAPHYRSADELLRDADIAMYGAKRRGKNCYEIFNRDMYESALERLQLESELRRALEKHELEVFYQPVIDLVHGTLYGFEALVRWHHPEHGLIAPARLIPVAVESGLIVPLGRWIFRQVCLQSVRWRRISPQSPPIFCVNLSLREVAQSDFLNELDRHLRETGAEAGSLAFEMTESLMLESGQAIHKLLAGLRQRGFALHIDDFGTGYSSLAALHQFPIDAVKIDESFVRNIEPSGGLEVIRAMAGLGESLGLRVIAEGVETTYQLQQLRQLPIQLAQGYLFARPLPAKQAEALLGQRFLPSADRASSRA